MLLDENAGAQVCLLANVESLMRSELGVGAQAMRSVARDDTIAIDGF